MFSKGLYASETLHCSIFGQLLSPHSFLEGLFKDHRHRFGKTMTNQIYNNRLSKSSNFQRLITLTATKFPVIKRVGKYDRYSKTIKKRKKAFWVFGFANFSSTRAMVTANTRGQCTVASTSITSNPIRCRRCRKRCGPNVTPTK